ncbi:MAG: hypothetical protein AB8B83_02825 [Bdellovibrionales bacterium]
MTIQRFFLTSAAVAGLFASASHIPYANAQKGQFLGALTDWAVTKVDGNSAAGVSGYCAVAKKYEGNTILTIARNQSSETSIAIDLQRPAFVTGQNLDITLDPGAGEQRDYSVTPASPQAFVVRLGSDEAFFNAIDRTGLLRVEVKNESFVFNISDISDGKNRLSSCLKPVVKQASKSTAPEMFGGDEGVNSNAVFIEELSQRIDALEKQNENLKGEVAKAEQRTLTPLPSESIQEEVLYDNILDESSQPRDVASFKDIGNYRDSADFQELRAENLRLKAALQSNDFDDVRHELETAKEENSRLSRQLDEKNSVSDTIEQLEKRIQALLSDKQRLENDLLNQDSDGDEFSSLQGDIDQLKAENGALKSALIQKDTDQVVADDLEFRISQMEEENLSLKKEKFILEQDLADNQNNQGIDISSAKAEYEAEIARLKSDLGQMRNYQARLELEGDEVERLKNQLLSLREENSSLQLELTAIVPVEESHVFKQKNAEIVELRFENEKLQSRVDAYLQAEVTGEKAIHNLQAENQALQLKIDAFSNDGEDADQKIARLTGLVESLQGDLDIAVQKFDEQSAEFALLQDENVVLRTNLDQKIKEQLELAGVVEELQNDADSARQKFDKKSMELASLQDENVALKASLDQTVQEQSNLAGVADTVAALQAEIVDKDERLNSFKSVPQRLKSLLEAYKNEKAENDRLEAENQSLASLKFEQQTVVEELAMERDESADLSQQLNVAQTEIEALRIAVDDGITKSDMLSEELELVTAENDALLDGISVAEAKSDDIVRLNEEIAGLQDTLSQQEQGLVVLSELRTDYDRLKSENNGLKSEIATLLDTQESERFAEDSNLKKENVDLRLGLSKVLEKFEQQVALLQSQKDKLFNLAEQNRVLNGQLDLAEQVIEAGEKENQRLASAQKAVYSSDAPQNSVVRVAKVQEPLVQKSVTRVADRGQADVSKNIVKPDVKPKRDQPVEPAAQQQAQNNIQNIAEQLARVEPAAGEQEEVDIVVADNQAEALLDAEINQDAAIIQNPDVRDDAQDFMERNLNQAQIYEEQLKRSLENKDRIDASRQAPIEVETLVVEKTLAQDDGVVEAAAEDAMEFKAQPDIELPELVAVEDSVKEPAVEETGIAVGLSQDPFEGIAVLGEDNVPAEASVALSDASSSSSDALPQPMKQPRSVPVEIDEPVRSNVTTQSATLGQEAFENVLVMANVTNVGIITAAANKENAYSWRAGELFGSGEQVKMSSSTQFDSLVKDYLERTEKRCPGEFAIVPDNSKGNSGGRVDSYEIACISDNVASSASVVFYNDGDVFNILAHETQPESMHEAMAVRDRIFSSLSNGRDS